MPSSYTTSLRLTLPATGELSGTWGTTVNTGITELTDAAIAGYVSIAMTDADYTLTVANGLTDQARRMMLNMTGTLTAARNVICPTASKLYIIKNATTGGFAITLKTSAGTGISIPNGSSMLLMCNGTDVVDAVTNFSSLTLGSPLLPASGGTGITSLGTGVATFLGTPSSANLAAAVTDETGSGALVFGTSPTLASPTITGTGTAAFGNLSYTGTLTGGTGVVNLGSGQFYKDASGNVGIGTASPGAKLHVNGDALVTNANYYRSYTSAAASVRMLGINSGNVAYVGPIDAGPTSAIFNASSTVTQTDFYNSGASAMTITSTGLGIGITSPANKLVVSNAGANGFEFDPVNSIMQTYNRSTSAYTAGKIYALNFEVRTGASPVSSLFVDASNNVGIGTSSPGVPLDVNGAARVRSSFFVYGTGDRLNVFPGAAASGVTVLSTNNANSDYAPLVLDGSRTAFNVAGTERARIDSSGNLGLGATPSAWGGGFKAFQFGLGTLSNNNAGDFTNVASNAYYDGSVWRYIGATTASRYTQLVGQHLWYTAPSGTAGNAITFTQAMTLDASGNLGVGTTDAYGRVNIQRFTGAPQSTLAIGDFATIANDVGIYLRTSSTAGISWASGGALAFYGGGPGTTERARITSGGDLLVGKTTTGLGTVGAVQYANATYVASIAGSTSATTTLQIYSTGASANRFYIDMAGTVFATNTTISAISDQRLKENVQDLDVGLDKIMALKPRKFDWKAGKGKDIKGDRGWIAQEFEQVFPDLIDEWKDPAPEGEEPYKSVRADLIPVLVKAIQEQQALITSLTARITALETP